MATITFSIRLTNGGAAANGGGYNATITRNGTVPTNCYVTSASLYISRMRCYTSKSPYLDIGKYGTTAASFVANSDEHAETVAVTIKDNSILDLSSGSIRLEVHSGGSGNAFTMFTDSTITLTIGYEQSYTGSKATISSNVNIGSSLSISIVNDKISGQNHKIEATFGKNTLSQSVAAGVSSTSLFIPTSWGNEIPNSTSGTATLRLLTYSGGSLIGSAQYTFNVNIPSSAIPTIGSFTASRIDNGVPASWGVYVQNKSGVTLTASNCAGVYGSTITKYVFSGGTSITSTSPTVTMGTITDSGDVSFTVTATDSRGRSATRSLSISVVPYSAPLISTAHAFRCQNSGVSSDTGTYISVSVSASYASCNGKNSMSIKVSYRKSTDTAWSSAVTVQSGVSSIIGNNSILTTASYQVKVLVTDALGTVEKIVELSTAAYTIFCKSGGLGVAFGKVCEREMAVEINPDWGLYHGNTNLIDEIRGKSGPQIVFSQTQPSGTLGMIWLKPAE